MYLKQVVLFVLWYSSGCDCATTRIWHHASSCSKAGFTCLPKFGSKTTLIYECPSKLRAYHIYINEYNGPKTVENLIIRNCKTLTLLFRCTKYAWEKKNMKYLEISNIENLKIMNVPRYQSLLPPTVVFENITKLENISNHTFTQANKALNTARCVLPSYNIRNLHFKNVSIGTIQSKAFYVHGFGNMTFSNVRIEELGTSSLIVNHEKHGKFVFENGALDRLHNSALEITGRTVIFQNNTFTAITPNAVKITADEFIFENNSVPSVNSQGLSVTSGHILVSSNRLGLLESGALSLVGGTWQIDTMFEFTRNKLYFIEDGGLLPDLNTYTNISTQVIFKENVFSCNCAQSRLLLGKLDTQSQHEDVNIFYKNLFDEHSENTCSSTCNLPLRATKVKIIQGECVDNITVNDICEMRNKVDSESTTLSLTYSNSEIPLVSSTVSATVDVDNLSELNSTYQPIIENNKTTPASLLFGNKQTASRKESTEKIFHVNDGTSTIANALHFKSGGYKVSTLLDLKAVSSKLTSVLPKATYNITPPSPFILTVPASEVNVQTSKVQQKSADEVSTEEYKTTIIKVPFNDCCPDVKSTNVNQTTANSSKICSLYSLLVACVSLAFVVL